MPVVELDLPKITTHCVMHSELAGIAQSNYGGGFGLIEDLYLCAIKKAGFQYKVKGE